MANKDTIQYDVFGNEINLDDKEIIDLLNTQISNLQKEISSTYEKIRNCELTIEKLKKAVERLNKKEK